MALINLYGGPGCGKSTIAAKLYSTLKSFHYNVELVQEKIKIWAYQGRKCKSFDQVFLFADQLHSIDILFQNGVQNIITDNPLFLAGIYAKRDNMPFYNELISITEQFNNSCHTIDIFLKREEEINYNNHGRYESIEEAKQVDKLILDFLKENCDYNTFRINQENDMLNYILGEISK